MAKARRKSHKLSKEIIIALICIVLVLAIVMTTIYFVKPALFYDIVNGIFGEKPQGGGGDIPTNEILGDRLEVHFVDVGQGDCIILRLPDGKTMMIDAGGAYNDNSHPDKELGVSKKIITYAESIGIKYFDAVMLTHSDSDHSDYMDDVIEHFDVHNIYLPDYDGSVDGKDKTDGSIPTKTYGDVVVAARNETYTDTDGSKKNATIHKNVGDVTNFRTDTYSMISYCRSAEYYDTVTPGTALELNSVSPISVLSYGGRNVVFTGDAEGSGKNDTEHWFIDKGIDIDADVLKVGHHGSRNGTSQDFLDYIDPEFAVISVGNGNSHGHPTEDTLTRLTNYRDKSPDTDYNGINRTYRTDKDGDIVLTIGSNGGIQFKTDNESESKVAAEISGREYLYYCDKRRIAA